MSDKDVETLIWLARLGWLGQPNRLFLVKFPVIFNLDLIVQKRCRYFAMFVAYLKWWFQAAMYLYQTSPSMAYASLFQSSNCPFHNPTSSKCGDNQWKELQSYCEKETQHRLRTKPYPTKLPSKLFPDQGRKAKLTKSPDCIVPKTRFPSW